MKSLFSRSSAAALLSRTQNPNHLFFIPSSYSSSSARILQNPDPVSSTSIPQNHQFPQNRLPLFGVPAFHSRCLHSLQLIQSHDEQDEDDPSVNEFLSRLVFVMRRKILDVYPYSSKETVNGMLLIIVQKVVEELEKGTISGDPEARTLNSGIGSEFSDDLCAAVWEASNSVLAEMEKAWKREELRKCMRSEEVRKMWKFAVEVGVRGELLREMRMKWAVEKLEDVMAQRKLKAMKKESDLEKRRERESDEIEGEIVEIEEDRITDLPERKGKIKYKIYGLDFSKDDWLEKFEKCESVAKETSESKKMPKEIFGKCRLVTEKILSLSGEDDPVDLLADWKELLQPRKVDWKALMERMKEKNCGLYLKVAEILLDEESFEACILDYTMLVEAHAKESRIEDAERILNKMLSNNISPDILTYTVLVHMYSKAGNVQRAKAAYNEIAKHGFWPDLKLHNSMIQAYVKAGQVKDGEELMKEIESRGMKIPEGIYLLLMRTYASKGDAISAQRLMYIMDFAGLKPSPQTQALLVETHRRANEPDQARSRFDMMINEGHRPDDNCISHVIAAYEKNNMFDKAVGLLLNLEKDGHDIGIETYTVLFDWLGKMQLVEEAEEVLKKIMSKGTPPFQTQITLCDMYAASGMKKEASEVLGFIEKKKENLKVDDFERIIRSLMQGGFMSEAKRFQDIMQADGHSYSQLIKIPMAVQAQTQGKTKKRK